MADPEVAEFLTVRDVAKLLGKSSDTVRYHEKKGHLQATRTAGGMRLFRREDFLRFLNERSVALRPDLYVHHAHPLRKATL